MSDIMCSAGCGNDVEYAACPSCEIASEKRTEEVVYKRGFDAGVAHQKKADPPPKAKQYRDQVEELMGALQEINDQSLCAIGQDTWLEVQDRLLGFSDIATKALAKVQR